MRGRKVWGFGVLGIRVRAIRIGVYKVYSVFKVYRAYRAYRVDLVW